LIYFLFASLLLIQIASFLLVASAAGFVLLASAFALPYHSRQEDLIASINYHQSPFAFLNYKLRFQIQDSACLYPPFFAFSSRNYRF